MLSQIIELSKQKGIKKESQCYKCLHKNNKSSENWCKNEKIFFIGCRSYKYEKRNDNTLPTHKLNKRVTISKITQEDYLGN